MSLHAPHTTSSLHNSHQCQQNLCASGAVDDNTHIYPKLLSLDISLLIQRSFTLTAVVPQGKCTLQHHKNCSGRPEKREIQELKVSTWTDPRPISIYGMYQDNIRCPSLDAPDLMHSGISYSARSCGGTGLFIFGSFLLPDAVSWRRVELK